MKRCHIHPWITVPVLGYIIKGAGLKPRGNWVPMKELSGGKKWQRLFAQRCEKPIQKVADKNPGLFEDILQIFNGCNPGSHFNSDISLVLHPLPKVPMLICYWKPEQMMGSDLSLFFDSTAEENLDIDYLYTIGSGFATMLEKLFLKHG